MNYCFFFYTVDVQNVSLIPSGNVLTIREGAEQIVECEVNRNAFPIPTLIWFLGSKNISIITGLYATNITIIGNKTENKKKLQCNATTNNGIPPKTASTILNIECKFLKFYMN